MMWNDLTIISIFSFCLVVQHCCQPTNEKTKHDFEKCEENFLSCATNKTSAGVCRSTFITCASGLEHDDSNLIPVEKKDFMLNFKCCFKELTRCLVRGGNNRAMVKICKERMFNCTTVQNKNYKFKKPSPKIAWFRDAPLVIKKVISDHVKCYTKRDEICCTQEYHGTVEIMLVRDCFHKLLHCRRNKVEDYCRNEWNKCFVPDCSSCTECKKSFYSNIPLLFKTNETKHVQKCHGKTDMNEFVQCVLNLRLGDLPSQKERNAECFAVLRESKLDSLTANQIYKTCIVAQQKAVDIKDTCKKTPLSLIHGKSK